MAGSAEKKDDKPPRLKITYQATGKLVPYLRNARTHSAAQVSKIASSIKEFGFTNPILLDGNKGILAGHGRLLAAQMLEMAKVPTIDLTHLSEAQRRAYVMADNQLATKAGWDDELLRLEMGDLQSAGFDLECLGFTDNKIGALLQGAEALPAGSALPDDGKAKFKQVNFKVTPRQADRVDEALAAAKAVGRFGSTGNDNANGNALHRICAGYLDSLAQAAEPSGAEGDGDPGDPLPSGAD